MKRTIRLTESDLHRIITNVINEATENGDYDGNYEELIRNEMHNLAELERKVPKCYEAEIHQMVVGLEAILGGIKSDRDFDNWNR